MVKAMVLILGHSLCLSRLCLSSQCRWRFRVLLLGYHHDWQVQDGKGNNRAKPACQAVL